MRLKQAAIASVLGLVLGVAACGSGPGGPTTAGASGKPAADGSAPGGSGKGAKLAQDELAFARCMRSHGVPNYPDPGPSGFDVQAAGIDKNSPAVQAAVKTCRPLMTAGLSLGTPSGTALLAFAQCIRGHGYPDFPDPTVSGGIIHLDWHALGLDGLSPQVQAVIQQCSKYLKSSKPGSGS